MSHPASYLVTFNATGLLNYVRRPVGLTFHTEGQEWSVHNSGGYQKSAQERANPWFLRGQDSLFHDFSLILLLDHFPFTRQRFSPLQKQKLETGETDNGFRSWDCPISKWRAGASGSAVTMPRNFGSALLLELQSIRLLLFLEVIKVIPIYSLWL